MLLLALVLVLVFILVPVLALVLLLLLVLNQVPMSGHLFWRPTSRQRTGIRKRHSKPHPRRPPALTVTSREWIEAFPSAIDAPVTDTRRQTAPRWPADFAGIKVICRRSARVGSVVENAVSWVIARRIARRSWLWLRAKRRNAHSARRPDTTRTRAPRSGEPITTAWCRRGKSERFRPSVISAVRRVTTEETAR